MSTKKWPKKLYDHEHAKGFVRCAIITLTDFRVGNCNARVHKNLHIMKLQPDSHHVIARENIRYIRD